MVRGMLAAVCLMIQVIIKKYGKFHIGQGRISALERIKLQGLSGGGKQNLDFPQIPKMQLDGSLQSQRLHLGFEDFAYDPHEAEAAGQPVQTDGRKGALPICKLRRRGGQLAEEELSYS